MQMEGGHCDINRRHTAMQMGGALKSISLSSTLRGTESTAMQIGGVLQFRKILVSVKFLSAILGPEMAAPILWTPGKKPPFCRKNLHVHKIPRLRGEYILGFGGGGGECRFYSYGRADFSEQCRLELCCSTL